MVARYKAGGFTEEQAEVLTYTLLDVSFAMREQVATQLKHQEAMQARAFETEAIRRDTAAMERNLKLWTD
ncbi:hypothetical protein PO883_34080, partial [Massilia sp. DJPM01]|uniref:hypothetical protein n=1 Tax=Massilia sp. DJPM01 TaxID=3024404 RepID=UPI00259E813C